MFDYERYFNQYRDDNKLDLMLSFNMPAGYETANGTFDVESKTVFINADYLKEAPDYEKAFFLLSDDFLPSLLKCCRAGPQKKKYSLPPPDCHTPVRPPPLQSIHLEGNPRHVLPPGSGPGQHS